MAKSARRQTVPKATPLQAAILRQANNGYANGEKGQARTHVPLGKSGDTLDKFVQTEILAVTQGKQGRVAARAAVGAMMRAIFQLTKVAGKLSMFAEGQDFIFATHTVQAGQVDLHGKDIKRKKTLIKVMVMKATIVHVPDNGVDQPVPANAKFRRLTGRRLREPKDNAIAGGVTWRIYPKTLKPIVD